MYEVWTHLYFSCRRHPSPTKEMLEPLLRTATAIGLNLDVSTSKALADSLDRAVVSYLVSWCHASATYLGFWVLFCFSEACRIYLLGLNFYFSVSVSGWVNPIPNLWLEDNLLLGFFLFVTFHFLLIILSSICVQFLYIYSICLGKIVMQGDDPFFNKLIRILATRCMPQVMVSSAIKR